MGSDASPPQIAEAYYAACHVVVAAAAAAAAASVYRVHECRGRARGGINVMTKPV